MITVRQHEKLIDRITSLSELELDQLLRDIGAHLFKNKLEHLIDSSFQIDDQTEEIERLEEEVNELGTKIDRLKDTVFDIRLLCSQAQDIEEYEDNSFDKIKSIIDEIKDRI